MCFRDYAEGVIFVIMRDYVLIDRSFGTYGQMLRTPDLRLADIRTRVLRGNSSLIHRVAEPDRGIFVFLRKGDFLLEVESGSRPPMLLQERSAAGIEDGRAHIWRSQSDDAELFVSSIPRRLGVLQQLTDGIVVVPPDREPFATVLRHCVEIHYHQVVNGMADPDDEIVRRCAEMCLIQFVRYVQSSIATQPDLPGGLAHDEHLLRAWSAYYAEPRRAWTVQALANAAGLSRTAFAVRFHKVFGTPPLQTITLLRLKQAEAMLLNSQAPLIEIAFTVGYNSEAAFVRAFHREYGVPPGKFRTLHGGPS